MKVLIMGVGVGDSADSAARLADALAADGASVEVLTDPVVAAQVARDQLCDVVVCCVDEVGDAVLDWCRRVRQDSIGVAVLVLADHASPERIIAALDAGADDCVTRPVRLGEIAARLRAVERRGRKPRPVALSCGSLTLDPASRRVWRGDSELELSPTDFALVEALLRRAGEVVSRAELLDVVWGRTPDDASNIVDQAVARVRKSVDEPHGVATIETVRGVGYRLVADTDQSATGDESGEGAPSSTGSMSPVR